MFEPSYVHPLTGKRYRRWTWCCRCERVYATAKWFANHWFCPHQGCSGTARDSSRWRVKTEAPCDCHPEYGASPVEGKLYPWGAHAE
jgi:hypothetical protein